MFIRCLTWRNLARGRSSSHGSGLPAARYRPPLACARGGHGVDFADLYVLGGANPGDIPYRQQTKFELVLNRTTARSLGLQFPATLLAVADEVIE